MSPALKGTLFGCIAAVAYTITNIALRDVAVRHDLGWTIGVTSLKAVPATVAAWILVAVRARSGLPALPPRRFVLPLLGTAVIMQFCGNVLFQLALSLGGLALTVALTFASLIVSGAILGRMMLGERISPRTAVSMAILIAAVVVLRFGAESASLSILKEASPWTVALAVVAGCGAGIGYGLSGVVIRQCLQQGMSHSATLVIISSAGVFLLAPLAVILLGIDEVKAIPASQIATVLAGGVFNAIAFFSVSGAFRYLEVVRVNLINSVQVAMAALAGVFFFSEAVTPWLVTGSALTIGGLVLLGFPESRHSAENPASSDETFTDEPSPAT